MVRGVVARGVATGLVLVAAVGCAPSAPETAEQTPLVLVLRSVADPDGDPFVNELRAQRLVPGRDLVLQPSSSDVVYADEAAVIAAFDELDREPAVIVAYSTPYTLLAAERFPDVPTVSVVNDPVASGLVDDRDAPEGSITGITFATPADRTLDLAARVTGGELDRVGYLVPDRRPGRHRTAPPGPRPRPTSWRSRWSRPSFADRSEIPDAVADARGSRRRRGPARCVERRHRGARRPRVARSTRRVCRSSPTTRGRRSQLRSSNRTGAGPPPGGRARSLACSRVTRSSLVPVEDPRRFRIILDTRPHRRPRPPGRSTTHRCVRRTRSGEEPSDDRPEPRARHHRGGTADRRRRPVHRARAQERRAILENAGTVDLAAADRTAGVVDGRVGALLDQLPCSRPASSWPSLDVDEAGVELQVALRVTEELEELMARRPRGVAGGRRVGRRTAHGRRDRAAVGGAISCCSPRAHAHASTARVRTTCSSSASPSSRRPGPPPGC